MSYSVDVNILLYASDVSSPLHEEASAFLAGRLEDPDLLYLPWATVLAYLRIATHPAIFTSPLSPAEALGNLRSLLALPRTRPLAEAPEFLDDYAAATSDFPVRGDLVPDAHLATVLRQHGVKILYTHDPDFRRFDFLDVRFPLRG